MRKFFFFPDTSSLDTEKSSSDDELLALESSSSDSKSEGAEGEEQLRKRLKTDFSESPKAMDHEDASFSSDDSSTHQDEKPASEKSLSSLPDDILTLIPQYLTKKELALFSSTAKSFVNNPLWKKYVSSELGLNPKVLKTLNDAHISYKKLYGVLLKIPYDKRYELKAWQLCCLSGEPEAIEDWVNDRSLMYLVSNRLLEDDSDDSSDSMELLEEEKSMDEKPVDPPSLSRLCNWLGVNPLHMAALSGSKPALEYVEKEFGIAFTSHDLEGRNLMHYAAWSGDAELMQYVYQRSLSIFSTFSGIWAKARGTGSLWISTTGSDNNGRNPLHYAFLSGDLKAIDKALELGIPADSVDNNGANGLHYASKGGSPIAMSHAVDVLKIPADSIDEKGANALHYAFLSGDLKAIDKAIELGIPVDSVDKNGANGLHYAFLSGRVEATDKAIELGISADSVDNDGANGLHYAFLSGRVEAIDKAIELGIPANSADNNYGANGLHYASKGGSPIAMSHAVDVLKIPADSVDRKGANALHYASEGGSLPAIQHANKAFNIDATSVDDDGLGALHYAGTSNSIPAIKYIIDDFDIRPWVGVEHGFEPLHYAKMRFSDTAGYRYLFERRFNHPPHGEEAPEFDSTTIHIDLGLQ